MYGFGGSGASKSEIKSDVTMAGRTNEQTTNQPTEQGKIGLLNTTLSYHILSLIERTTFALNVQNIFEQIRNPIRWFRWFIGPIYGYTLYKAHLCQFKEQL